jgi:hypothetical protein
MSSYFPPAYGPIRSTLSSSSSLDFKSTFSSIDGLVFTDQCLNREAMTRVRNALAFQVRPGESGAEPGRNYCAIPPVCFRNVRDFYFGARSHLSKSFIFELGLHRHIQICPDMSASGDGHIWESLRMTMRLWSRYPFDGIPSHASYRANIVPV